MKDFTLQTYKQLLTSLQKQGFVFLLFNDIKAVNENTKYIILRQDVDNRPQNSLQIARIQSSYGVKGSYYFMISQKGFDEKIIREIASLGHEIGYHYNDLVEWNGNFEQAIRSFEKNLKLLRTVCDVQTICMDGSPLSKWDNRDLWKQYNYRDFGIKGEPYFDLDSDEVFYLSDTGRSWNSKANRRDLMKMKNGAFRNLHYHSTFDIMKAVENGSFPEKTMITFHPQRWTDNPILWTKELIWQNMKNQIKQYFFLK